MSKKLTIDQREHIAKSEANKKFDKILTDTFEKLKKAGTKNAKKAIKQPKYSQELVDGNFVKLTTMINFNFPLEVIKEYHLALGHQSNANRITSLALNVDNTYMQTNYNNPTLTASEDMVEIMENLTIIHIQKKDFKKSLKTVLNSITTYKQGSQLLPELKNWFVDDKNISMALVPIEQINNVKEMLRA